MEHFTIETNKYHGQTVYLTRTKDFGTRTYLCNDGKLWSGFDITCQTVVSLYFKSDEQLKKAINIYKRGGGWRD